MEVNCDLKENKDSKFCIARKIYPLILVNPNLGILRIVNRKSTTSFKIQSHETKAEIEKDCKRQGCNDEWTPEHEVEMAIGSGFHRIHESDDNRWALWDAGKEGQNGNN